MGRIGTGARVGAQQHSIKREDILFAMIVSAVSPEVLLIDDDHMDVKAVMRAFRRAGIEHPISVVDNGVEALKALRSRTFRARRARKGSSGRC